MRRKSFRIGIAVIVGVILLLGVIFSIFVQDQATIVMLAILAVMYVVYLVKLIPTLKKDRPAKQTESPLARRR